MSSHEQPGGHLPHVAVCDSGGKSLALVALTCIKTYPSALTCGIPGGAQVSRWLTS